MPIRFLCPVCGKKLTAPDTAAGVTGPCPSCGQEVSAPLHPPGPSPFSVEDVETPAAGLAPSRIRPASPTLCSGCCGALRKVSALHRLEDTPPGTKPERAAADLAHLLRPPQEPTPPALAEWDPGAVTIAALVLLLGLGLFPLLVFPALPGLGIEWRVLGLASAGYCWYIGAGGILGPIRARREETTAYAGKMARHVEERVRWGQEMAVWRRLAYCPDCRTLSDPPTGRQAPLAGRKSVVELYSEPAERGQRG